MWKYNLYLFILTCWWIVNNATVNVNQIGHGESNCYLLTCKDRPVMLNSTALLSQILCFIFKKGHNIWYNTLSNITCNSKSKKGLLQQLPNC